MTSLLLFLVLGYWLNSLFAGAPSYAERKAKEAQLQAWWDNGGNPDLWNADGTRKAQS